MAAIVGAGYWLSPRLRRIGLDNLRLAFPERDEEWRRETLREGVAGIWEVIRTPSMGRVFFAQIAIYPSYLLVAGLWGASPSVSAEFRGRSLTGPAVYPR